MGDRDCDKGWGGLGVGGFTERCGVKNESAFHTCPLLTLPQYPPLITVNHNGNTNERSPKFRPLLGGNRYGDYIGQMCSNVGKPSQTMYSMVLECKNGEVTLV